MIFNKISSIWDEAWWKSDSFTTSSLYKINNISTSYGTLSLGDYKDYYEIVPGIGTFQLVVTTEGMNGLSNTTYNYSFEIKIVDSLGRLVLASDIVGPDIYSDSITFTSRDYSTYYVEITNSFFGNFQYAATLNSVSSGGGGVSDTIAPTLSSITPADGATGVAVGANFVLTFNEAVKAGTGSFVVKSGTTTVSTIAVTDTSQVTFSGSTVTINPTSNLDYSKSYTVTVASGVIKDTAGNSWSGTGTNPYDFTTVAAPNSAPTLTSFGTSVKSTNEDTAVSISFAELLSKGNEADVDGTVTSFVVKAVSTGTLKIGATAATATAWSTTNNTVDSTKSAFWTPAKDANGTLNAFTAVAKDNSGAESATAVQATVAVTAVNDRPTLTSFGTSVKSTNEDTAVSISFAELLSKGNEADVDGTVTSFVVKAVSTGTLKIGATAATAIAWSTTNNTVDSTKSAFWTPATNATGSLNAFTVVAKDNGGLESSTLVQAVVYVGATLDTQAPTVSTFSPADGANGVAVGSNFVLTFNEVVKAGTGSFVVKNGSTIVATIAVTDTSQVTFSGSTVTINPTSNLDYSKSYSVSVAAGVIKDNAGNNWAGTGTNPYDFITTAAATKSITLSKNNVIDSLISGLAWDSKSITYSFSNTALIYESDYDGDGSVIDAEAPDYLINLNENQKLFIRNELYKIQNFTGIEFTELNESQSSEATIRFALTNYDYAPAWGYFPSEKANGGDVWLNANNDWSNLAQGYYPNQTIIHEIGHALGLKHPHQSEVAIIESQLIYFPIKSLDRDSIYYTTMSYRDYAGESLTERANEYWRPYTFMVDDIAALQYIYGKNINHNKTDTNYQWEEGKVIFETIWDGGGIDTINWKNKNESSNINLNPGALSFFGLGINASTNPDVGSSRVDLQACKLEYSIVSPK